MKKILIIDSDRGLCAQLSVYLGEEGFEVTTAHTGGDGLNVLRRKPFNLVVLDIAQPGGQHGFGILKQIRARTGIPIIILSAKNRLADKIMGLELGADDYVSKPFNFRELLARIRAVLRRSYSMNRGSIIDAATGKCRVGDVEIDMNARVALKSDVPLRLTGVEFHILEILVRNFGQVVSRDKLANLVLNRDLSVNDRSIDVHVSNLRKKLGLGNGNAERIKSVRGCGYMYVCPHVTDYGVVPPENSEPCTDTHS